MHHFGTVQATILTLFQTIFGGEDWIIFHDMMSEASPLADYVFLVFVGFTNVALLNILTAIFVENAIKMAQPTFFEKALEGHREQQEQARVLNELCREWDVDQNELLSFDEFCEMNASP